jgi:thiol-disulfide isomerase/thioredoxin
MGTSYFSAVRVRVMLGALCLFALSVHAAPKEGDVPPDYVGRLADGTDVRISDYAGKAVVLSFWATWCPYCLKELPVLNAIQVSPAKEQVQVIAVNTEERDVFRAASRALGSSLSLKLAYDPGKSARNAYGVGGIPHLVIIGKDGKIVRVLRGYAESALPQIVDDINQAIAAAPDAK